ncbi:HAD family hydrolase [Arthrobacter sp. H5]|uniref:HAD family hydrolase n=1 Tax=Arthrobacter sp. H5 TaxID=1267973 RepID=UPI0004AD2BE8|nr:HAD family hydrolase [Arthrobacter sp. H5]
MRPSRGVISFDLDGTLIQGPFASVLREVCDAIEPASPDGLYQEVLRRHEELLLEDEYAAYGWSAMVAAATGARGISMGADIVTERIVGRLEEAATRTRLLHPDTPEVLAGLRSAGWRVVILTNGRRAFQEPVIAGAGLLPVIDGLVTSDDAGSAKPGPATFEFARGAAGLHIHVGDRLDHDIAGAARSGALSLLLRVDAPVSGLVRDVGAARYRTLQEYLRTRHAVERHIGSAAQLELPPEAVPDAVATDLWAAAQLIDALESQRSAVS